MVIDATRDAEADVPVEFKTVQWTKLPGGDAPEKFCARVKALLGGEAGQTGSVAGARPGRGQATPRPKLSRPWLIPVILAAVAIAVAAVWLTRKAEPSPPAGSPVPARQASVPRSEARKLADEATRLTWDLNFTRETAFLADELSQRALTLDAGDAEVWAAAAGASLNLIACGYDTSAERREKAQSQADRAIKLDSQSVLAAIDVARCLYYTSSDAEALLKTLRVLHRRAPDDSRVVFFLFVFESWANHAAVAQDLLREMRSLPRTIPVLDYSLILEARRLRQLGRYAEAEVYLDEELASPTVIRPALYGKLILLEHSWHELGEAETFIATIPARFQLEPAFGSAIAYYWLWRPDPEKALQALARVPQEFFEELDAHEPKRYLTGWAQAERRTALGLVEFRALLLALTGQVAAAREAWQLRTELGGTQNRPDYAVEAQVDVALNEPEAAIAAIERAAAGFTPGNWGQELPTLRYHPAFAAIRGDPRIQRILARGATILQNLKAQQLAPGEGRSESSK